MSKTFELGGQLNTDIDYSTIDINSQIKNIIGGDLEQVCKLENKLLKGVVSNIVGLAHYSFATHRHMILDPDTIWITIEHGLATHIKENSEELRKQFVSFDGKKTIGIRRDNFIRGGFNNWEDCFDEFSEKIGEFIGPKKDLIVGKFSTTENLQRVSSEIVLMDAMSKYFDYLVSTCCYIPVITLLGKVEDWELIRDKVNSFDSFGLSWWTDYLKPVIDQFILAAKGNPNIDFWKSWYKEGGGSGGPFISGHINALFPYVGKTNKRNKYMGTCSIHDGNTLSQFNQSISKVPFIWSYLGSILPMEFSGGLVGITQNAQGCVNCSFGWAVRDESVPVSNYPLELFSKDMIIYDKNGNAGLLKFAEVEHGYFNPDDKTLCQLDIEFNGIIKKYLYDFDELYIKKQ